MIRSKQSVPRVQVQKEAIIAAKANANANANATRLRFKNEEWVPGERVGRSWWGEAIPLIQAASFLPF